MNFMGIGPMELVLILIIALVVFGPGKLPEISRAVGKSIRDFRAMSDDVRSQFSLELEEATDAKKSVQRVEEPATSAPPEEPEPAPPPAEPPPAAAAPEPFQQEAAPAQEEQEPAPEATRQTADGPADDTPQSTPETT